MKEISLQCITISFKRKLLELQCQAKHKNAQILKKLSDNCCRKKKRRGWNWKQCGNQLEKCGWIQICHCGKTMTTESFVAILGMKWQMMFFRTPSKSMPPFQGLELLGISAPKRLKDSGSLVFLIHKISLRLLKKCRANILEIVLWNSKRAIGNPAHLAARKMTNSVTTSSKKAYKKENNKLSSTEFLLDNNYLDRI